jgi:hypothetical protein
VLIDDLIEATSDLSGAAPLNSGKPALDDRGLSLPVFGIFERIADRIDREDSFVSVRLNEG